MSQPVKSISGDDGLPLDIELAEFSKDGGDDDPGGLDIPTNISRRLYTSHFLSTWNSRSFEMGAVLFLADIFPMTLLPLSIYALVRSASAILFSPTIGHTIDTRRRLPVVRFSIGKLC